MSRTTPILPQHVTWGWRQLPMPVIAAVHGVAFGGGFQIMSGADIRIAAPDTRFAIDRIVGGACGPRDAADRVRRVLVGSGRADAGSDRGGRFGASDR